jgi:RNA recognition motif-containing protein
MFYRSKNGHNTSYATVIMADESTAKAAMDELDGAPLFNRRLVVRPYKVV